MEEEIMTTQPVCSTQEVFHAGQAVLLTNEDREAFDAMALAFHLELHPTGPIERAMASQIVLAAWNMERANKLEAALAQQGIDPLLSVEMEQGHKRIATFRMRAERTFHKFLKELRTYQIANRVHAPVLQNKPNSMPTVVPKPRMVYPQASGREPYVRPSPKIGRNEICPCGSRKKYKYCCLQNEANLPEAHRAA